MNSMQVKTQIIDALSHPEAGEGLYLDNLLYVHEDEERPVVDADQEQVLECLKELIHEGRVAINEDGEKVIFMLLPSS